MNNLFESIENPLMEQEKKIYEINNKISIKFKARNMKKGITTIYGLDSMGFYDDMTKIASTIKKKCGCASYIKMIDGMNVIEIQGNKSNEAKNILVNDYNILNNKIFVL